MADITNRATTMPDFDIDDQANRQKKAALKRRLEPAQSPFELQRERIKGGAQQEREAVMRRLGEREASRGFGRGSGVLESGERDLEVELAKIKSQRLGDVDIAESQEATRLAEAERERDFLTGTQERGFAQQQQLATQNIEAQGILAEMARDAQFGFMNLQDQLSRKRTEDSTRADSYYNFGASGQTLTPEQAEGLQIDDPLAYAAYNAGAQGMNQQDYQTMRDRQTNFQNLAVMSLNPDSDQFMSQLGDLARSFGYNVPGVTDQPAATTPVEAPLVTQRTIEAANELGIPVEINEQTGDVEVSDVSRLDAGDIAKLAESGLALGSPIGRGNVTKAVIKFLGF